MGMIVVIIVVVIVGGQGRKQGQQQDYEAGDFLCGEETMTGKEWGEERGVFRMLEFDCVGGAKLNGAGLRDAGDEKNEGGMEEFHSGRKWFFCFAMGRGGAEEVIGGFCNHDREGGTTGEGEQAEADTANMVGIVGGKGVRAFGHERVEGAGIVLVGPG